MAHKQPDDLTGEYIKNKRWKRELQQDNKHYYLMVLDKDITYQNKPATKNAVLQFNDIIPDLDKYYYVNRDFYMDPKTLQSFGIRNTYNLQ